MNITQSSNEQNNVTKTAGNTIKLLRLMIETVRASYNENIEKENF